MTGNKLVGGINSDVIISRKRVSEHQSEGLPASVTPRVDARVIIICVYQNCRVIELKVNCGR